MIYLMGSVLPQVSPVSKVKIVSVQKGFPNLAYTLPGFPWYWIWEQQWNDDFFSKLNSVVVS